MRATRCTFPSILLAISFFCAAQHHARAAETPITLHVDARDVSRRILHAALNIPAQPGPLTLLYPKWIPGEHGPTGPISDLTGLKISAAGQPVPWRRDPLDNCAFQVEVPNGVNTLQVQLDFLLPSTPEGFTAGASSSPNLVAVSWNTLLLYPKGPAANALSYVARLQLPDGWKFATALPRATAALDVAEFAPVTLETLIDSPLIAGAFLRSFDLSPGSTPGHRLNVVADAPGALELKSADLRHFSKLVDEVHALFGAYHYRQYDFLLTLSDQVAHFGLEHHESSDNRTPERMLIDEGLRTHWAGLLPHEMIHSWNGKYRRPADLTTRDYHQPMNTELLWVYEGLTSYLDDVLATRCGLWTVRHYLERTALTAAQLDHQRGRTWRPLADTAVAAHLLYSARPEGTAWRRSVDFYPEGGLIWLEADVAIRDQTRGRRSLDDFCRSFFGGQSGQPTVVAYTLDDVLAALNEVAPLDWRAFFQERVYAVQPQAPLGGIQRGGWRLAYRDTPSDMLKNFEMAKRIVDLSFSIGLTLKEEGAVLDTIPGLAADQAGIAPGMKLLAVNQRRWKPDLLRTAIREAKSSSTPIELLLEDGDVFRTCRLDYHQGERYPHLERDTDRKDWLAEILEPRLK